ncbi:MAG: Gfo/Idh/MocA family protein [Chloroflexota bacterium]
MERVRVGVIGTGGIVKAIHLPQLQSHGKVDVAWCADVNETAAREAAARFGVPVVGTDYRAVLREHPVDAVTIGTPHNAHYEAVMAALEAGVHVCCEKPLAFNLREAEQMAAEAERRGVITFVPFSYWFIPAARLLKDLIGAGELGELLHVTGYYGQGNALGRAPLVWRFQKAIAGSGALGDLGSHIISLTYLWAGPIARLTAQMKTFVHQRRLPGSETEMGTVDVDDDVQLIGELAGGGLVNLSASRTYTGRGNYQRIEVSGREGGAVYDNAKPDELAVCIGKAWRERQAWGTLPAGRQHRLTQMHVFVDGILHGKAPAEVLPNFQVGLQVQRVMDAAERSAESGTWVEV